MDFLALYITLKMSHATVRLPRMVLASIVGAVWALIITLLEPYTSAPLWQIAILATTVLCAGVMTSISLGKRTISAVSTLSYIAVSAGLGGIMTALYSFITRAINISGLQREQTVADVSPIIFIAAVTIAGAVSLIYGQVRERLLTRKRVKLTLFAYGKSMLLELLCDSGNLLCDPISGKPVIIVSAKRICDILPNEIFVAAHAPDRMAELSEQLSSGLRLMPARSVTGQGILLCFCPDRLCMDTKNLDALIAIDTHSDGYDGCDGIIPQILLNI